MSLRKVFTANLSGYGDPVYPRLVSDLATALVPGGQRALTPSQVAKSARLVPHFKAVRRLVRTADGYTWPLILEYAEPGHWRASMALALPGAEDWERRDGSQLDRLPAVYFRDSSTVPFANAILGTLIGQLSASV